MIVDSHAHLNHEEAFDADRDQVVERAREAGVTTILNVATSAADAPATVATARQHDGVWASVGIHPHEATSASDAALDHLEQLASDPRVIAWGEIGLDYHYLHAPKDGQRQALERQLTLAGRLGLPVSVHTREAEEDTVSILRRCTGEARGVIHCFTGDQDLADRCLDLGFCLSFSGIVTFRNAEALRGVARRVPADRLLVETDSPYLAPAPRRGGRNEPSRVAAVVDVLATVRGVTADTIAAQTTGNFRRLFGVR
ncbi:MAG: TatD family hydrolase [Acidobacteriota bacterium]